MRAVGRQPFDRRDRARCRRPTPASGTTHRLPLTCTVHAPHWPMPQPNLVPFRLSMSRNTHRRGMSAATSTVVCLAVDGQCVGHRSFLVRGGTLLGPPLPCNRARLTLTAEIAETAEIIFSARSACSAVNVACYAQLKPLFDSGSERTACRSPRKSRCRAPAPPAGAPARRARCGKSVVRKCTSIAGGACVNAEQREVVEVALRGAAVLDGDLLRQCLARPSSTEPCTWFRRCSG